MAGNDDVERHFIQPRLRMHWTTLREPIGLGYRHAISFSVDGFRNAQVLILGTGCRVLGAVDVKEPGDYCVEFELSEGTMRAMRDMLGSPFTLRLCLDFGDRILVLHQEAIRLRAW